MSPFDHRAQSKSVQTPENLYDYAAALVAQLDRVLPSEGKGRGFESRLVRHISL